MVKSKNGLWCAAVVSMLSVWSVSPAWATHPIREPSPEELARRCIHHVRTLAQRCADANAQVAHECVQRIEHLLAHGEEEQAQRLARHCINNINRQSQQCVQTIHQHCRQCVQTLLELGEPELAHRVRLACDAAIQLVRQSQHDAVSAIRAALGDTTTAE